MKISGLEFNDDLDSDGDMRINYGMWHNWLTELDARQLISHLEEVFDLHDQE